mgnify:CR=1 FL=1
MPELFEPEFNFLVTRQRLCAGRSLRGDGRWDVLGRWAVQLIKKGFCVNRLSASCNRAPPNALVTGDDTQIFGMGMRAQDLFD